MYIPDGHLKVVHDFHNQFRKVAILAFLSLLLRLLGKVTRQGLAKVLHLFFSLLDDTGVLALPLFLGDLSDNDF